MFFRQCLMWCLVSRIFCSFYQMEDTNEVRRKVISVSTDIEIGCALRCEQNRKCKKAGIHHDKDDILKCFHFGKEVNDVIAFEENFTFINKVSVVPIEALLSEGKPASSSSVFFHRGKNHPASLAFDGNLGQQFSTATCSHNYKALVNWIQVDLTQISVINRVKIYNRMDYCSECLSGVTIEIADSEDMALNNKLCASFVSITTTDQIENFDCFGPMLGRYVRVTQSRNTPQYMHICEMQVYGYWAPYGYYL